MRKKIIKFHSNTNIFVVFFPYYFFISFVKLLQRLLCCIFISICWDFKRSSTNCGLCMRVWTLYSSIFFSMLICCYSLSTGIIITLTLKWLRVDRTLKYSWSQHHSNWYLKPLWECRSLFQIKSKWKNMLIKCKHVDITTSLKTMELFRFHRKFSSK